MDAWDLLVRVLSHYWRVTRSDNMAAQALLEKAAAIGPNYGRALGVLATSHTFGAHMGWEDMAAVAPIAERAARAAIVADGEDPWARHALGYSTHEKKDRLAAVGSDWVGSPGRQCLLRPFSPRYWWGLRIFICPQPTLRSDEVWD